jgi:c-di-GMP-binding flagellar brake protein YcgR
MVSEPRRYQRRRSFRADLMVNVIVQESIGQPRQNIDSAGFKTKTLNISDSGMLFLSKKGYTIGELLECEIILERFGINEKLENIKAEVRRCEKSGGNAQYRIAVCFIEQTSKSKIIL